MDLAKLKDEIRKEYKYRIEMHAHTYPASGCSEIPPKKMAEIYADLGYDAVVITNHFIYDEKESIDEKIKLYMKDYYEVKKYAEKKGLKVLLGSEIRFTENINDYLVYGVDEKMLKEIFDLLPYGIENFSKKYRMQNSVIVQAHPFRDGQSNANPNCIDGIETFNMHPGHNSKIGLATKYANANNIEIMTIGSDFHHLNRGHEGVSALLTKTLPKDSFELAKILKSKDYLFEVGGLTIVLP